LYVALLLSTFNTWYMGFVAGMILADLYANGKIVQVQRGWKIIPTVLLGLFLGGYPIMGATGTIYHFITPGIVQRLFAPLIIINWNVIYLTIGATIIVASVLMAAQVANIFRKKFISGVGKYTFSIYLVHVPILYSFGMFAFVVLKQKLGLSYHASAILAIVLSIPFVTLAAVAFEKYVDSKSIGFSSRVANIILGYAKIPGRLTASLQALRRLLKKSYVEQPASQELAE